MECTDFMIGWMGRICFFLSFFEATIERSGQSTNAIDLISVSCFSVR